MTIYHELPKYLHTGCSIVEIGAHIGTDTIKLYRQFKPVKYIAIEPDLRNRVRLRELGLPIQILPYAIGNKNGKVPFWYSSGNIPNNKRIHTDSNSLLEPIKQPAWVTFQKAVIQCRRLDGLIAGDIDLIWMDVQGAELLVFEGAVETLKRTRYIYTECQEGRYVGQPGRDKILEALPDWKLVFEYGENVLLRNEKK